MDPIIGIVILAAGVGAWFYFKGGKERDNDAVRQVLAGLDKKYTVLSGLIRMNEGGMDQIDHVVVSPYGVFVVLEVKETGAIQCRMNSLEWPRSGMSRGKALHNPVWRNRRRINALEKELPGVSLSNVVVIVNAKLTGDRGPEVLTFQKLAGFFKMDRPLALDENEVNQVLEKLG